MIYLLCGQKGTGKTLFITSYLRKRRKKYDYIFSNFPISFMGKIHNIDWVNFRFPPHSAILIDEAQLYFNSREFSKLTKDGTGMQLLDYLTMCRHYEVDIFFITQSHKRIDLQIRELSDYVFYLKKTYFIPFINRPFFVKGVQFPDILEFEKYVNPNNFSNDFVSRFLFKRISKKDLKCYDTHYIDKKYIDKEQIFFDRWVNEDFTSFTSKNYYKKNKISKFLKYLKFKIKMFYIKFFKLKKEKVEENLKNENKYF